MALNFLVLLASQTPGKYAATYGTGVLAISSQRCYVLTCRHVITEASGGTLFAIPSPRKTKNPPGGYSPLRLGAPTFHPLDSSTGTFDIAVAAVLDATLHVLASHTIVPINLPAEAVTGPLSDGQKLTAAGFPVDYVEVAVAKNQDEPLPPKRIEAMVRDVPLPSLPQTGFTHLLREGVVAEARVGERIAKGFSGGAVFAEPAGLFAGIVLASGLEIEHPGMHGETLSGFVFGSAQRVLETLQSARPG